MLKDDTKDQIPLFELTVPERSTAKPVAKEAKQTAADRQEPASTGKAMVKKAPAPPLSGSVPRKAAAKSSPRGGKDTKSSPGPVPEGDVRLTANIREDLHLKLKIVAATRRTTIGELIENLVEHHL
jgi:hypothetical protein